LFPFHHYSFIILTFLHYLSFQTEMLQFIEFFFSLKDYFYLLIYFSLPISSKHISMKRKIRISQFIHNPSSSKSNTKTSSELHLKTSSNKEIYKFPTQLPNPYQNHKHHQTPIENKKKTIKQNIQKTTTNAISSSPVSKTKTSLEWHFSGP